MPALLCTIGFAGKTAEEFFALLQGAQVELVVDIRQNRGGQLSGFAKYPDLKFFLQRVSGINYMHEPLFAPAPELLKSYRNSKDWNAYEAGFLLLMQERGIPQSLDTSVWPERVALLCSEPGPEKCHRRLSADLLARHWESQGKPVEIRHLVSSTQAQARSRRKRPTDAP